MAPWADILYACDFAWWNKYQGVPEFAGMKLTADKNTLRRQWGVHLLGMTKNDDRLHLVNRGTVGWGGNSGYHMLNLAAQMEPRRIVLVGFDMRVDLGLHWHGSHEGLNNPDARNVGRWRRVTDAAAEPIAALGIDVVNVGQVSALEAYRKASLEEAIKC